MNTKKVIAGRIKPAFLCQIFRFYIYLFIIVYYDGDMDVFVTGSNTRCQMKRNALRKSDRSEKSKGI